MNLLIDHCVLRAIENKLREIYPGRVTAVRERDAKMLDPQILHWGFQEKQLIITEDSDFGDLIFRDKQPFYAVLFLRFDEETLEERVAAVLSVIEQHEERLQGTFAVYQKGLLRFNTP